MKRAVQGERGPAPLGAYSAAIVAGDYVFVAGQGPIDPETGAIQGDNVAEQTRLTLANLEAHLVAAGATLADVVRVNAHLASIADFDEFNAVYADVFTEEPRPARTTVGSELAGILVEVDCIAYVPRARG
jgi:2-iminobutanoate/2-iminopropanoate deaminase